MAEISVRYKDEQRPIESVTLILTAEEAGVLRRFLAEYPAIHTPSALLPVYRAMVDAAIPPR
jgi:hypothetical protein